MWGKLDGVLYGLTMDENNNSHKYYDVFEAKQRQGASTMQYVNGKESEITQMQIYMMMLEERNKKVNQNGVGGRQVDGNKTQLPQNELVRGCYKLNGIHKIKPCVSSPGVMTKLIKLMELFQEL